MYEKNKSQRITLRLNPDQFEFIRQSSEDCNMSPSDFLRWMIDSTRAMANKTVKELDKRYKIVNADGSDIVKSDGSET